MSGDPGRTTETAPAPPPTPARAPGMAIVHDYFTQRGGAERLVEHLAALLPAATIHAAVVDLDVLPSTLAQRGVRTTPLGRLRRLGVPLRVLAPRLPWAFRSMPVGMPAVIISSSAAFAHHVRPPAGAVLVVYCHTPPRFLWHTDEYFAPSSSQARLAAPALALLRRLDREAAGRADIYVANSAHTAAEIQRVYGRHADVIHPPISTSAFTPTTERSGRFLVVARLKPHKRIDLAIAAANDLGAGLDVIGEGPDLARLRRGAGSTVRFLGRLPDEAVRSAMARCEGLIVPGREDFGMTMAEVQAAGRPPIAFAAGGALEIVRGGETGFLFTEQTPAAIAAAMMRARAAPLDADLLVASASRFDTAVFDAAILGLVERSTARNPAGAAVPPGHAVPSATDARGPRRPARPTAGSRWTPGRSWRRPRC